MDLNSIIVIAAAVVIILAIVVALPLVLRKTHVPVQQYIDTSNKMLNVVQGLAAVLPGTQGEIATKIVAYVKEGVQFAEQAYLTGQITDPTQRKTAAMNFVENAFAVNGHSLNEMEKTFIADAIDAAVYLLPKTGLLPTSTPIA